MRCRTGNDATKIIHKLYTSRPNVVLCRVGILLNAISPLQGSLYLLARLAYNPG